MGRGRIKRERREEERINRKGKNYKKEEKKDK